jgi:hypothetical protein
MIGGFDSIEDLEGDEIVREPLEGKADRYLVLLGGRVGVFDCLHQHSVGEQAGVEGP